MTCKELDNGRTPYLTLDIVCIHTERPHCCLSCIVRVLKPSLEAVGVVRDQFAWVADWRPHEQGVDTSVEAPWPCWW